MKYSIKTVWTLIIVAIVLLPSLIVIPWFTYQNYKHNLSSALSKESLINYELVKDLEYETKKLINILKNKSDPIVYTLTNNKDENLIASLLKKILQREPSIHGLMIFSAQGRGLIGMDKSTLGNYHSIKKIDTKTSELIKKHWGLHWEKHMRSPEFVVPVLGRHYVGAAKLHEGRYLFNISVPLMHKGKALAFFIAEVDIESLWKIHLQKANKQDVVSYLVDRRGVLLTKVQGSRYREGDLITHRAIVRTALASGSWTDEIVYKGLLDNPVFGVVRNVKSLNWSVISEVDERRFLKPLEKLIFKTITLVLMLIVLSAVVGFRMVRVIMAPIKTVTNGMQMYAHNEGELKQLPETKIKEINEIVKGFNRMVVERSQMDAILRETQQRLILHREQTPLGVIEWNTKFEFRDWNPAAEKMFGFTKAEVLGKHITDTILPDSAKAEVDKVWQALLNNTGGKHSINENVCKDGRTILCEWHNTPLVDESGKIVGVASFVEDITDKTNQEEQVRRSQKMDALGKLTGGIAHDFNNLLNVIMGYSDLISGRTDNEKIKKFSEIILQAGERGTKLTKKLLNFSSNQAHEASLVNVNGMIVDEQQLLEKSLTARVQLKLKLGRELWPVFMDSADLQDAILNLSINAMHAIDGNGYLAITTSNEYLDENLAKSMDVLAGDYVKLQIEDSGCGMDEETLSHIFDPFYTTKGDRGTGLGLSQVYGFVKRTGGGIKVESRVNAGTTMSLYFPRYMPLLLEDGVVDDSITGDAEILLAGSETILLVDDEVGLRELGSEILKRYGYHVVCAEDGAAALSILEQQPVDLVLSDVIMPNMDGYQLAKKVQHRWPKIKIQMISGFSDGRDSIMDDDELHQNLLYKPYQVNDLLQKVRHVLNT